MSTSLVTTQTPLIAKKTKKWRTRSIYGLALKRKLDYLMDLFQIEANKPSETFDINTIINLSRTIDFNISIQLSNIRAEEEKKALKDLEKWKNELISKIGSQGVTQAVFAAWKY